MSCASRPDEPLHCHGSAPGDEALPRVVRTAQGAAMHDVAEDDLPPEIRRKFDEFVAHTEHLGKGRL